MLYSTKIATFHNSCNINIAQRASYCKAHIARRQRYTRLSPLKRGKPPRGKGCNLSACKDTKKNPTFANIVGLFFKKSALLHLKTLGGIVGLDGFTLYHYRRVASLHILAGGRHGAGDVAGAYQQPKGSNE